MNSSRVYRGPDGRYWVHTGNEGETRFDDEAGRLLHRLYPAVQDTSTSRWERGEGEPIYASVRPPSYTEVAPEPLADPRIAHLHTLLMRLLADYEQHTGRPHPQVAELREAMEDVAFLPVQARRTALHAARNAPRR